MGTCIPYSSKVEKYIKIENLSVSDELFKFVNEELLPGTKIIQKDFWEKFDNFAHELTPENKKLIKIREKMQMDIDSWHIENRIFSKTRIRFQNRYKKYRL